MNGLSRRARVPKGRVLVIPGRSGEPVRYASARSGKSGRGSRVLVASKSRPKVAGRRTAAKHYQVRTGDTLYQIAARHGTTVATLLAVNSLPSRVKIRPGDRLKIPRIR
jgi:LysM repeat protein